MPLNKEQKVNFTLFLLAILVTFSMLALLQLVSSLLFVIVLLLMHGGVVLFIVSKKRFQRASVAVKPFYKREYIMLALYLPILAYKILGKLGLYTVNECLKMWVVLVLTGLCLVGSAINALYLFRHLKKSAL
ncbi:MAG: hypothetical protein J6K61_03990 [Clostridia bacterium]|nr:hypothetical protein [Clostridia bacterium]